jgi:hypothetical protein
VPIGKRGPHGCRLTSISPQPHRWTVTRRRQATTGGVLHAGPLSCPPHRGYKEP